MRIIINFMEKISEASQVSIPPTRVWMLVESLPVKPDIWFIPIDKLHDNVKAQLLRCDGYSMDKAMRAYNFRTGAKRKYDEDDESQYEYLEEVEIKCGVPIIIEKILNLKCLPSLLGKRFLQFNTPASWSIKFLRKI